MSETIKWTLVQSVSEKTAFAQRTVGEFATKREAVQAMEALREPKTRVTRVGHAFVFQPMS